MTQQTEEEAHNRRTAHKIFIALLIPLVIMGGVFTTLFFDNPMGRRIRYNMMMGEISPLHGGGMIGWLVMAAFLGTFFVFSIWLWRSMTHSAQDSENRPGQS